MPILRNKEKQPISKLAKSPELMSSMQNSDQELPELDTKEKKKATARPAPQKRDWMDPSSMKIGRTVRIRTEQNK